MDNYRNYPQIYSAPTTVHLVPVEMEERKTISGYRLQLREI